MAESDDQFDRPERRALTEIHVHSVAFEDTGIHHTTRIVNLETLAQDVKHYVELAGVNTFDPSVAATPMRGPVDVDPLGAAPARMGRAVRDSLSGAFRPRLRRARG